VARDFPPPRKSLGQNFLHDPAVIQRIVRSIAHGPDETLVEIGPGRGALTVPLLDAVESLTVIEFDRELVARLPELPGGERLVVHQGDAVRFDFQNIPGRLRLVGNLPYQISSPLLFRLAALHDRIEDMVFMLQKEVVDRITATHGTSEFGRLTVMLGIWFDSEKLFDVGPGAFKPPPKVHSSVVRLTPRATGPMDVGDASRFEEIVRRAFAARRKTIRNGLKGLVSAEAIETVGVDPSARPETIALEQWAAISRTPEGA